MRVEIPNYKVTWDFRILKSEDPILMEIVFYFSGMEFLSCHCVNLLFTTHQKIFWGLETVIYAPLTSWSWFDYQRPHFLWYKHYVKMTRHSQVGNAIHSFFFFIWWVIFCFPFFCIINFYSIFPCGFAGCLLELL